MGFADTVCVNSNFTRGMVEKVFPSLAKTKDFQIVYPCVDVNVKLDHTAADVVPPWNGRKVLLSINRFERKKDIGLAIKAYAGLEAQGRKGVRLVVAGLLYKTLDRTYLTSGRRLRYSCAGECVIP